MPEAPRRVARDYRLLLVRDWPWGLARRSVPQRWRLGGRSGSRPLCLPERPCTCTSSVTLRSWLRWMLLLLSQQRGSQERLLGVSSPARLSCCRLLAAKEKSLCLRVGRFTSVKEGRDLLCLLSRSLHFLGAGVAALAMRKKRGGFPTTLHAFNRCSSCHEHTLILTHTHVLPHIKAHKDTILTHFSLNSHKQEYVKHINKACTIFRPLLFSKPTC